MARIVSSPSPHSPDDLSAALAEIARLRAENAALSVSRGGSRALGYHLRTVPVPKKAGSLRGLFLADRELEGGLTLSYYVGANGKCTWGGGFQSRGFGLWGAQREPFLKFAESGGLRADLFRPDFSAALADYYVKGGSDE
jgi:hypothetical protein